jgi:hypothetical protein
MPITPSYALTGFINNLPCLLAGKAELLPEYGSNRLISRNLENVFVSGLTGKFDSRTGKEAGSDCFGISIPKSQIRE